VHEKSERMRRFLCSCRDTLLRAYFPCPLSLAQEIHIFLLLKAFKIHHTQSSKLRLLFCVASFCIRFAAYCFFAEARVGMCFFNSRSSSKVGGERDVQPAMKQNVPNINAHSKQEECEIQHCIIKIYIFYEYAMSFFSTALYNRNNIHHI
jgi:hypothetical protein